MIFAKPLLFLLLLLLIPIVYLYVYRYTKNPASFTLSSLSVFQDKGAGIWARLQHLPFVFLCLAFLAMVTALARPQQLNANSKSTTEGIHIMLAMDISTSMLAQDLKPDRVEAAKEVATQFINDRPNDNIGLVAFAGESFVQCPMTNDRPSLINMLHSLQPGMIEDGTAIGNGIATAVGRLKDIEAKSKVIILLTDGSNNSGSVSPKTAAEMAKTFGIKIYTIGVGSRGTAPYPVQTVFGVQYQNIEVDLDEGLLSYIAELTSGKYFRAVDNKSLKAIYDEINQLEKVKINVEKVEQRKELYLPFVLLALILSTLALLGRMTVFRVVP